MTQAYLTCDVGEMIHAYVTCDVGEKEACHVDQVTSNTKGGRVNCVI